MRFPRKPSNAAIMKACLFTQDTGLGVSSFLTSPSHAEKVADFAELNNYDNVCEIGSGFGIMSEALLSRGVKSLTSFEWNPRCLNHLEKFTRLHHNHVVKQGNPYLVNYSEEFKQLSSEDSSNLTIFVNQSTINLNFLYVRQLMHDIALKQQASMFDRLTVIALLTARNAERFCGVPDAVGANFMDLLLRNYCHTELGPRINKKAFVVPINENVIAMKFTPRQTPLIDMEHDQLTGVVQSISGISAHRARKVTLGEHLLNRGILNNKNIEEVVKLSSDIGLNLNISLIRITLEDIIKLVSLQKHLKYQPCDVLL